MKIIKRSGSEVDFDIKKIINAITKANNEVLEEKQLSEDDIHYIAQQIEKYCEKMHRSLGVEEIQDLVESKIMKMGADDVARRYIKYRYEHELIRKSNTTDEQILSLIECENEEVKQENSNKNPTVSSVQRDYMAGEVSKDLSRRILLPKDIVEAHDKGIIHFHDLDYFAQHMHNCFTGGTKFVTDRGVVSFRSFKDGDKVFVKDMYGQLREATVHKYGKQHMQKVTFKNCKMKQTVICTPDHRWVLSDGSVTTNLKIGDKLFATQDSTDYEIKNFEDAKAFCYGFVIGDGFDHQDSTKVRLCGDKVKYSDVFKLAGYSKQSVSGNKKDIIMYKKHNCKQDILNGKSWRLLTAEQKALMFKGYYAADGDVKVNKVSTVDERICTFIEETSCLAGYYISSKNTEKRDTEFKKDSILFSYHFITKTPSNWLWKVEDIERDRHGLVDAWCIEEPVTHTFTLDKGIVTGNCDLVNLEDMLQNGTVISGTLIERPHSFSTACNITTQIVAQVASSQYGGQSISLAHLAPFVDVSRKKITQQTIEEVNEGIEQGELDFEVNSEKYNSYINRVVKRRVLEEIKRGVQMIQYQVITLMTTNGQAPFITVFMYLNEAKNEQEKEDLALIIEEVIKQRYQGVKNEKGAWITPAFPKLIYVLEEDNITEDSKYWYLTKLAAKCSAKRLVPDYISEKKMKELKEGNCFPVINKPVHNICENIMNPI